MFIINKEKNSISKISKKTFTELGFKEREHLQEWIVSNPDVLGEDLLIIQKEFRGFNDTNERLDLLALDKQGNLVIIENKLDDSGKDVTWQVMKYASYCASLTKANIRSIYQEYLTKSGSEETAEEKLSDFLDGKEFDEIQLNKGQTQRIMMVAGNFRKEVTSTVLWLMNYKLRFQCFKVTPYKLEEQLFLNIEQIIPMKEAEEYMISMAEKTHDDIDSLNEVKERDLLRKDFWNKLLPVINSKSQLFRNISPQFSNWISAGIGMSGIYFNFVVAKSYARCELYIDRGVKDLNKQIFDLLYNEKTLIEAHFMGSLEWQRLDDKRAARIKYESKEFNVLDKACWDEMIQFMVDGMIRFEIALKPHLKKVSNLVKNSDVKHNAIIGDQPE